jgi:hypothetical protein
MIEMCIVVTYGRWLKGKLNPERVEAYYVRGKSKMDVLRILNEHGKGGYYTAHHLRHFANWSWGTAIVKPNFAGRGLWLIRDHGDRQLVPVWEDCQNASHQATASETHG